MRPQRHYYSKLLLFGEYSILLNSSALSIPYSHFHAELSFIRDDKYTNLDKAVASNHMLKEFAEYLYHHCEATHPLLDIDTLNNQISDGLYFESTIPQGYGLGSSGALCAAVYEQFAFNPVRLSPSMDKSHIQELREIFAAMESFFHGKSSGIDPLAIYLRLPIHIHSDGTATTVGIPRGWDNQSGGIFLIDSGMPGKTGSLVPAFLNNFAPGGKISTEGEELCTLNNACISHLLKGSIRPFWDTLLMLSAFQFKHLPHLIPESMHPLWKNGIDSNIYHLKICGSGGGGFLIGFAPDYSLAKSVLRDAGILTIPVYLSL